MGNIGHRSGEQAKPYLNFRLRAVIRLFILCLFLAGLVGCTPVPPKVIKIDKNQSFRPSTPDDVKNFDQVIASVITVATSEVGLPAIDHLELWLYPNTESFTYWGARQGNMRKDAAAFTRGRSIHVNLENLEGNRSDNQVAVLAHEYGHAIQAAIGGRGREAIVWFNEGFAEWVRARILDSLLWRNNELAVGRARRELNHHREFELSILHDSKSWALYSRKSGGFVKTYVLAFMAVDHLIRSKGLPAALEYLKTGKFEQCFGVSQSDFEAEFKNYVRQSPRHNAAHLGIPKPEWKVGYSWSYEEKQSGGTPTSVKVVEIIGTDSTAKLPVFLVKDGEEELSLSMETLGVVQTRKHGSIATRRDKPSQILSWPLQPDKEWRNLYNLEDIETKKSYTVDRSMVVSGVEEVKVPAGTFKAIKIEAFDNQFGSLVAEYWYAPEVRWFIRTINYGSADTNVRERQLVSSKINN
jgi:hypothetical protein